MFVNHVLSFFGENRLLRPSVLVHFAQATGCYFSPNLTLHAYPFNAQTRLDLVSCTVELLDVEDLYHCNLPVLA